jgi:hypothetical protein
LERFCRFTALPIFGQHTGQIHRGYLEVGGKAQTGPKRQQAGGEYRFHGASVTTEIGHVKQPRREK